MCLWPFPDEIRTQYTELRRLPSLTCLGNLRTRIGQKGRRGSICSLCLSAWAEVPVFSCLPADWDVYHWLSQFSDLCIWTDFPQSPACRWQIMRLLSLHNHMSQFLYICIDDSVCFWRSNTNMSIIKIKIQSFSNMTFPLSLCKKWN